MSGGLLPANSRAGDVEIYDSGRMLIFESDTDIVERQIDRQKILEILQYSRETGFFQLPNIVHDSGSSPNVPDVTLSIVDAMGNNTVTMTSYQRLKGEMRKSPFDLIYKKITDLAWESYTNGNASAPQQATAPGPEPRVQPTVNVPAPQVPTQQAPPPSQAQVPTLPFSNQNTPQNPGFELPSLDDLLKSSGLQFDGGNDPSKAPSLPPLNKPQVQQQSPVQIAPSLPPLSQPAPQAPQSGPPQLPPLDSVFKSGPQPQQRQPQQQGQGQQQQVQQKQPNQVGQQSQPAPQLQQKPKQPQPQPQTQQQKIPVQQQQRPSGAAVQQQAPQTVAAEQPVSIETPVPVQQPKPRTPEQRPNVQPPKPVQQPVRENVQMQRPPERQPTERSETERPQPERDARPREERKPSVPISQPPAQRQSAPPAMPAQRKPPVAWERTQEALERLEESLHTKVLVFYAANSPLGMEDMRYLYSHLRKLGRKKSLCVIPFIQETDSTVIWRMATLIREFCDELVVILPEESTMATTMFALAADSILMNPFGFLSPIDTSFTHSLLVKSSEEKTSIPISEIFQASSMPMTKTAAKLKEDQAAPEQSTTFHPLITAAASRQFALTQRICSNLLKLSTKNKRTDAEIARIVVQLTTGYPSAHYPIVYFEAQSLGLPVSETNEAANDVLWDLVKEYVYITQPVLHYQNDNKIFEKQNIIVESTGRRTIHYSEELTKGPENKLIETHTRWRELTQQISINQLGKESTQLLWKELQLVGSNDN